MKDILESKKNTKNDIISPFSFCLFTGLLLILFLFLINHVFTSDVVVWSTFFINLMISLYGCFFLDPYPYSLNKVFWLFNITFFCIAPIALFSSGALVDALFVHGEYIRAVNDEYIRANLYILFANVIYISIYSSKLRLIKFRSNRNYNVQEYTSQLRIILLVLFSSIIFFVLYKSVGFATLISRSYGLMLHYQQFHTYNNNVGNSAVGLLIQHVLRFFAPASLIMLNFYMRKYSCKTPLLQFARILLIALTVVTVFPLGVARYYMATVYLGVLLSFLKMKSRYAFTLFFLFGILLIFPLLSIFRFLAINEMSLKALHALHYSYLHTFVGGDFDSYRMLLTAIRYIDMQGITYMHQLLGVIMFFVPRHVWLTKPIGSGAMLAHYFELPFDNLSCPFIAEALLNFGLVGIAIFYYFLAKSFQFLDQYYWRASGVTLFIKTIYVCCFGLIFYMLRGDLMSSYGVVVTFSVTIFMVYKIMISKKMYFKKLH